MKINQFERQFMMENLDPKDANHQDGSIVLKELRLLKEAEYAELEKLTSGVSLVEEDREVVVIDDVLGDND